MPGALLPAYRATALPSRASFPLALIEDVIAATGTRERRRRLLPAAAVMVFVLGCCLFYGDSYGEVARKLAGHLAPLAGPSGWRVPGSSALARARRRLGPAPFALLFTALAGPAAGLDTPGAAAFGRLLVAVDGTTLDVPYTAANLAAWGPPPSGSHGSGGFPQVRLVTAAGCGTRALADAVLGPGWGKGQGEQALAIRLAARGALGTGMLVLADRNFCGHNVVTALTANGADVLIRVKTISKLPLLSLLPDGSYRSVLPDPAASRARHSRNKHRRHRHSKLPPDPCTLTGIPIRVIEADITITPARSQPRTERYRLITTILDPAEAPATQIAATYAQRWEAETGYKDLKVFLRGPGRVLRSTDPAGVEQETWALLCACQLIHTTRASAATTAQPSLDPDRISFTITLRATRRRITTGKPEHTALTEILTQLLPPKRRPRTYPRALHTTTGRRRKLATHATTTTCTITIAPPPQLTQPTPSTPP
jgi:Insertion element 4 transposase N-terminal/Transposase DDE domain